MTAQPTELDGRRARRGRNREAVVDALLELFREGDLNPSVAAIAERSGVSLRSVFRYFNDLDEMGRIAIARHFNTVRHLFELPGIGEGSRAERIEALVQQRVRAHDGVAPIIRATLIRAPFQPVIAEAVQDRRTFLRRQVDRQFAAELKQLPSGERFSVAAAIDALTSFETLELLRTDRGLSASRTSAVLRESIERLLPA